MGVSGTVALPARGSPVIPAEVGRELPGMVPGGSAGLAPVPSWLLAPPGAQPPVPAWPTVPVPGGRAGPVVVFTPSIDKLAPYGAGFNRWKAIRSTNGDPINWRRWFFRNIAAARGFLPYPRATPSWTANAAEPAPMRPASSIPFSSKRVNTGGLLREFYVDEQLFNQLTDRENPWPLVRPVPAMIQTAAAQPKTTVPYFYQLTRYTPAASYGQTAQTLLSAALTNLLPATFTGAGPNNPYTMGGSPYGSY